MARTTPRPTLTAPRPLQPLGRHCPLCGETMWAAYLNDRTSTTLDDVGHLTLHIRRCRRRPCLQFRRPYRPEAAGRLALPTHEFGLDVMACVGTLREAQHRSLPAIHQPVCHRGMAVAPRTVTPLLARSDALCTLSRTEPCKHTIGHIGWCSYFVLVPKWRIRQVYAAFGTPAMPACRRDQCRRRRPQRKGCRWAFQYAVAASMAWHTGSQVSKRRPVSANDRSTCHHGSIKLREAA